MAEERRFPLIPVILLTAGFLFLLYHLYHVLIPFALGFAVAYVANPLVTLLEVRGLRRSVIVVGLFLAVVGAIIFAAGTVTEVITAQFSTLQAQAPAYLARGKTLLTTYQSTLMHRFPSAYHSAMTKQLDERLYSPLIDQAQNLPSYVLNLFPLLSLFVLVPFVAFFLLTDGSAAIDGFIQACPSRYVEQALHLISEIDQSLGSYLRGIILEALAIAAGVFVGLLILDVTQAMTIAALAGFLTFIPEVGIVVSALSGILVALVQFGTFAACLKVAALFAAVKLADYIFLQPMIAKHSVHLHTLVLIGVLMVGGEFFDIVGLIFAVPVTCVLKALFKVVWAWYSTEARLRGPELVDASATPYT